MADVQYHFVLKTVDPHKNWPMQAGSFEQALAALERTADINSKLEFCAAEDAEFSLEMHGAEGSETANERRAVRRVTAPLESDASIPIDMLTSQNDE